jgi:cell division protein FtsW (lipid II flippase)
MLDRSMPEVQFKEEKVVVMEVFLDYSLIVLFFIILFVFILIIATSNSKAVATPTSHKKHGTLAPPQKATLAYGLIVLLFVMLCILAFFSEKERIHVGVS